MSPRPYPVTLTPAELMQAALVGVMREVQNRKAGRSHAWGGDAAEGWSYHVDGACGECAVAKLLGRFWSGAVGDLTADDVGPLQVRATSHSEGRLILHPRDPDNRAFVLVTGRAPDLTVRGWIPAKEAKRREWWADPTGKRPAFFVPIGALADMALLMPAPMPHPVHLATSEMARPPPN